MRREGEVEGGGRGEQILTAYKLKVEHSAKPTMLLSTTTRKVTKDEKEEKKYLPIEEAVAADQNPHPVGREAEPCQTLPLSHLPVCRTLGYRCSRAAAPKSSIAPCVRVWLLKRPSTLPQVTQEGRRQAARRVARSTSVEKHSPEKQNHSQNQTHFFKHVS